jgi:hypothetical protein
MTLAQASPELEWIDYMEQDLTLLMLDCDAVYVLPGADQSNGARIELTVAVCLELPIYHSDNMPPNVEDEKIELEVEEALNSSLADRIIWMAQGGLVVAVIFQLLEYLHRHA